MIRSHLQKPGVRYILVGGSVYILELIVIVIAQHAGITAVGAVTISFVIGLLVSFVLQKFITFSDKRKHHKVLIPQLIAVGMLVVWNLGFTILLTKLLQAVLPAVAIRTIALAITTIWNFYLYKTRIFRHNDVHG